MLLSERLKIVIDVNVVISGLMSKMEEREKSPSFMVLKQLESRLFTLMTNPLIFEEYRRKLHEMMGRGRIDAKDASHYLSLFQREGVIDRAFVSSPIYVVGDPTDNIYFQSSNCLEADYLITGNTTDFNDIKPDLEQLGKKLKIVTPAEFLQRQKPVRTKAMIKMIYQKGVNKSFSTR